MTYNKYSWDVDDVELDEDIEKAARVRQRQGRFAHASGDVINALGLLRDRQRVGGGDSIAHGLEVATEYPFLESKDYKADIDEAEVREVELSSVKATQASVRRERVRDFVENPRVVPPGKRSLSGVLEDLPVIFETDDGLFLQDGHHRMAAAKLLGQRTAMARVVTGGYLGKEAPVAKGNGHSGHRGQHAGHGGMSGVGASWKRAEVREQAMALGVKMEVDKTDDAHLTTAGYAVSAMKDLSGDVDLSGMKVSVTDKTLLSGKLGKDTFAAYDPRDNTVYVNPKAKWANGKKMESSGWLSDGSPKGLVTHEVGHYVHAKSATGRAQFGRSLSDGEASIAGSVSRYAKTSGSEFVAETFAGIRRGKTYPPAVMDMYTRLGGPKAR